MDVADISRLFTMQPEPIAMFDQIPQPHHLVFTRVQAVFLEQNLLLDLHGYGLTFSPYLEIKTLFVKIQISH